MKRNKYFKKFIAGEKEDLNTLKKLFRGEKLSLRFDVKKFDFWKVLSDNWLFTIILIAFFLAGLFLGAISFENTCNKAILECETTCNEFYGVSAVNNYFSNYSVSNFSLEDLNT